MRAEVAYSVSEQNRAIADRIRTNTEAILPNLAARAEETEALRRVPDANISELRAAGWFKAFARFAECCGWMG